MTRLPSRLPRNFSGKTTAPQWDCQAADKGGQC
jgi:predicted phage terminase large subunit-like protein